MIGKEMRSEDAGEGKNHRPGGKCQFMGFFTKHSMASKTYKKHIKHDSITPLRHDSPLFTNDDMEHRASGRKHQAFFVFKSLT